MRKCNIAYVKLPNLFPLGSIVKKEINFSIFLFFDVEVENKTKMLKYKKKMISTFAKKYKKLPPHTCQLFLQQ